MVATDSVNKPCVSLMARRKGPQDECVVGRLGLVKAELQCDHEPSTVEIARHLASRRKTTVLTESATARGSQGSAGRCARANLAAQRQLRALRAQLIKIILD